MKVFGKIIGASAAALCLWALPAAAQELKLGYVNSERVLRDSAPAKAAQAKLEAEFGRRERELNDVRNRLKAAADKFEKDAPTLAESEKTRRQRELGGRADGSVAPARRQRELGGRAYGSVAPARRQRQLGAVAYSDVGATCGKRQLRGMANGGVAAASRQGLLRA
jgi:hypothetical protein